MTPGTPRNKPEISHQLFGFLPSCRVFETNIKTQPGKGHYHFLSAYDVVTKSVGSDAQSCSVLHFWVFAEVSLLHLKKGKDPLPETLFLFYYLFLNGIALFRS